MFYFDYRPPNISIHRMCIQKIKDYIVLTIKRPCKGLWQIFV